MMHDAGSRADSAGVPAEGAGVRAEGAGALAEGAGVRAEGAGARAEGAGAPAEGTGVRAGDAGGSQLRGYLELLRPANVVTALADILAGFAASGALLAAAAPVSGLPSLPLLLLATAGLYGGGVVLNDFFDASLDAVERPERPIPSGRVTARRAGFFGFALLLGGIAAAGLVSMTALLIATAVAGCALVYDAAGKHHPVLGPLNMGACRGGNLLLGAAAVPAAVGALSFLGLIPIAYIAAVTAISRGEVHGGRRSVGWLALGLAGTVVSAVALLGMRQDFSILTASPFLLLFAALVLPRFVRAAREPRPERIRAAVGAGILALIPLDAALAAGFGGWLFGAAVLLLLPVSRGLARAFAVT